MKLPKLIRNLLADGQPRTARELYTALGTHPIKTAEAASNQALRGILVKDSSVYPARYSLGRPIPDKLTKQELMDRERDRKSAARRLKGCRPIEEVRAEAARKTAQRVLEAKRKEVERLSAPRKEPVFVERPSKPAKRNIRIEPRRFGMTEAKPEPVRLPCSDTFIKENPDKLQRLPPGVWSTGLRFQY